MDPLAKKDDLLLNCIMILKFTKCQNDCEYEDILDI